MAAPDSPGHAAGNRQHHTAGVADSVDKTNQADLKAAKDVETADMVVAMEGNSKPEKDTGVRVSLESLRSHKGRVLIYMRLVQLAFAVISFAVMASLEVLIDGQAFCLAIGVIITATCLFWLILLPVNLAQNMQNGRLEDTRARFEEWRTRTRSRWQDFFIPASLVHDLLFGLLAFGAGCVAANLATASETAASAAFMILTSIALVGSMLFVAMTEFAPVSA